MKYLRIIFIVAALIFSINTFADTTTTTTVVEKHTILTPVPKSVNCTTIPAHWEGNVWIYTQNACIYENRQEGVAWIQDYWACTTYTMDGNCSAWEYRPGHWVKTLP